MIPAGGAPSANGNGGGPPGPTAPASAGTPQPAVVGPGPVPMTFQVGQAQGPGAQTWAVLICHSSEGIRHMFLDLNTAKIIGGALLDIARAGNLTLPGFGPAIGG